MNLPKIMKSDRGVFSGIKNKLGFADEKENFDEEYYTPNDYENYDDYSAYDDGYAGAYSESGYEDSPRARSEARRRVASTTSPRLISVDDVRANTQVPDSLTRDPLLSRWDSAAESSSYGASSAPGYREPSFSRPVENAADYLRSSPQNDIPKTGSSSRSQGYDSLFAPSSAGQGATSENIGSSGYDPYDSYEGNRMAYNPTRRLSVLKPLSYGEAELIAKTIKGGDVVILSLRNTPEHLTKRILDFSFGVSSALEASVECVADRVFVIVRGNPLSADEKMTLRNQGVL